MSALPFALQGALALTLAAVVALEASGALADAQVPLPPAAPFVAPSARPGAAPVRTAALTQVALARPIFDAARRPPSAPSGAAESAGTAQDPLPRVTGLVIVGASRSVLFAGSAGGKPVMVAEGGRLGGYTVRKVALEGVTVVSASGEQLVRPSFDANATPPAATVAVVAPNYPSLQDIFKNGPPPTGASTPPGLAPYVPPARARAGR